jgi:hypothetical protein
MKKGFLIIGLLAVSALQAQKKEEEAIRRLLQQQTESWNSGNLNGFMQTYWEHDSLMFIGKNGITQGWKIHWITTKDLTRAKKQWGSCLLILFK